MTPIVRLRGALKQRAGSRSEHEAGGATLGEVLRDLERANPLLGGWILDERGRIRRHINVYINGERGEEGTAVGDADVVDVLPAISGG